jgi:hypothetical protein
VFENRVLKRLFGFKGEELTGGRENYISEDLHDLYSSPDFIRVIKSRRTRWVGNVACLEKK